MHHSCAGPTVDSAGLATPNQFGLAARLMTRRRDRRRSAHKIIPILIGHADQVTIVA
jgi:hypothetical protein